MIQEKLCELDRVDILPWETWMNGNYNEQKIDLTNSVDICDWCMKLNKYHLPNDTGDVSDRFMIGLYQLAYIPALIRNYEVREFGEAIASALIHFIACFENCGIVCFNHIRYDYYNENANMEILYNRVMKAIPHCARQVYYKAKQRDNRYDGELLNHWSFKLILNLIYLHNSKNKHLELSDSFMLAMSKLQARELNTH